MSDSPGVRWWAETAWWDTPEYAAHVAPCAKEFHLAVDAMARHFDRTWWRKVIERREANRVAANLIGHGTLTLRFLLGVGTDIRLLDGAAGFESKMAELKKDKNGATLLECEIAGLYADAGLRVSFPTAGQDHRTPDLIVDCSDHRTAVECKKLEREEWEHWADGLMLAVVQMMPSDAAASVAVEIQINDRLSEIRTKEDECPGLNHAIAQEIIACIRDAISAALASSRPLPVEFDLPGLGHGWLRAKEGDAHSSVSGFAISPVSQLRRLITNGLYRASDQLPANLPGIVVVQSEYLPDPDFARLVFDAATKSDPDRFTRVAAWLILPVRYLGDNRSPVLLVNQHSPQSRWPRSAMRPEYDPGLRPPGGTGPPGWI